MINFLFCIKKNNVNDKPANRLGDVISRKMSEFISEVMDDFDSKENKQAMENQALKSQIRDLQKLKERIPLLESEIKKKSKSNINF